MSTPPAYFEDIRRDAQQHWSLLEANPVLAAPWRQLFMQVQSPRHIVSELLQNADDAGATEASISIQDGVFRFEHNGSDFTAEQFRSLCQFGYSNKRALHTIGFRGIGFKSTFSLGDTVELLTPTLAARFHRNRFTEPCLMDTRPDTGGATRIQVVIADELRRRELEKNLDEWLKNPLSLLFFRHLRQLRVDERVTQIRTNGPGPIPGSEWLSITGPGQLLLVRSAPERFPEEALAEIRQERTLSSTGEVADLESTVDIVLGATGRLYVVLPTGVETRLPFACNAPFIQDPARLKIKDPEISPTNRWLLERAGKLAATTMLHWLAQDTMPLPKRARSYGLLPGQPRSEATLEGSCVSIIQQAFTDRLQGQPVLLTDDGRLVPAGACVALPKPVFDIWPAAQASEIFDKHQRPPLCRHVEQGHQDQLARRGLVEQISSSAAVSTLRSKRPPAPATWPQLLALWTFVAQEHKDTITLFLSPDVGNLCIVPAQGRTLLYSGSDVVRLAEQTSLATDELTFLSQYLTILDSGWLHFLHEQQHTTSPTRSATPQQVAIVQGLLTKLGLGESSRVDRVVNQAARVAAAREDTILEDYVRLAHLGAKLDVTTDDSFPFITADGQRRTRREPVLYDEDGTLEVLQSESMRATRLLHAAYAECFSSCTRDTWRHWVASGHAGITTCMPISPISERVTLAKAEREARRRGAKGHISHPFRTHKYVLYDWNFEPTYWHHWKAIAATDERVWFRVAECFLRQRPEVWNYARSARICQIATTHNEKTIADELLAPAWILRLRDLPCLRDTRGVLRKPGELFRRTPETEMLMDVEPFVDAHLDTEASRLLLDLLGVQSTPASPDRIIDRLRALAKTATPPVQEVEKLYRKLDLFANTCSTADLQHIQQIFHREKLVFADDGCWVTASAVFQTADDVDVPGLAVIRPSMRDLAFWGKIDVALRPSVERAIEWLKSLPSGAKLSSDDRRRVEVLLPRFPERIWQECQHWLDLADEWAPLSRLRYAVTMHTLIAWQHLYPHVKQQVADLRRLPEEVLQQRPFSELPPLAQQLEHRLDQQVLATVSPVPQPWMATLGAALRRVQLSNEADHARVRAAAERLAKTTWCATMRIDVIPYLNGVPAGTPRGADVLWSKQSLYVAVASKAKLARVIPEELGNTFGRSDIRAALAYSFDRDPRDVQAYVEENFTLEPLTAIEPESAEPGDEPPVAPLEQVPDTPPLVADDTADDETYAGGEAPPPEVGTLVSDSEPPKPAAPPTNDGHTHLSPTRQPAPSRPSLIERFARTMGYRSTDDGRFVHKDGSWMGRTHKAVFPWERWSAAGHLLRSYFPREVRLVDSPLELDVVVWELLDRQPDTYALVLVGETGDPIEVTGTELRVQRDAGVIELYPATYRLVYKVDSHA